MTHVSTPLWVLDLLGHKVECVPSRVWEESGVKGESYGTGILGGALKHSFKVLCVTWKPAKESEQSWRGKVLILWSKAVKMIWSTWTIKISTLSDLDQARDDDGDESYDLGVGEEVLHPGAPFHIGAVHKGQQTWKMVFSHKNHMRVLAENSSQHVTICTVKCGPA